MWENCLQFSEADQLCKLEFQFNSQEESFIIITPTEGGGYAIATLIW